MCCIRRMPIPSMRVSKTLDDNHFYQIFCRGNFGDYHISTMYYLSKQWYFLSMCLCLLWCLGCLYFVTTNETIGCLALSTISSSSRNFLSHTTFFCSFRSSHIFNYVVESTMHDCFTLLQLTTPAPSLNTYSLDLIGNQNQYNLVEIDYH